MCCAAVLERTGLFQPSTGSSDHVELAPEPRSARLARRFVAEWAGPLPATTAEVLALLTSELVTNAILHARTPMQLGVVRNADEILVVVADENLVQPEQQPYSDERSDGRGIVLLSGLADRWGVDNVDGGKVVWFTLRLVPQPEERTG